MRSKIFFDNLLDLKKIKQYLSNSFKQDIEFHLFEHLPSTNDYLKQATLSDHHLHVCLAEEQTAGRGRLNRTWHSPFASNIYLSFKQSFSHDISTLGGLSLVVSLSIVHALQQLDLPNLMIKWPNDVLCQGKKLAGILIDLDAQAHDICQAIIGIGINVNMDNVRKRDIEKPWTSIANILGKPHDRNHIIALVLQQLKKTIPVFAKQGLPAFLDDWRPLDYLANKTIQLVNQGIINRGKVIGIDQQGHLLLQANNSDVQRFSAGDVSVVT